MSITLPNLIVLVAMLGGFSLLGGIALFLYHVLEREKRIEDQEKKTLLQYEDIIKKAHQQAADLLETTTKASDEVITQVKDTHDQMTKNLDKVLQTMADKHIQTFDKEAETFQKDYEGKIMKMQVDLDKNTSQIIQSTQASMTQTLDAFSKSLADKTTLSAQAIDQKTTDLLAKAEKDIDEYKKAQIAKIDATVVQFVQKTCQDVLGISLPPEMHKEIIIKALEKSKKEGVFDV